MIVLARWRGFSSSLRRKEPKIDRERYLYLRRVTFLLFQPIHDVQVREDSKIVIRIGFSIGTEANAPHGNNPGWIGGRESLYLLDFLRLDIYTQNLRRNSRSQHENSLPIFLPIDDLVTWPERDSKRLPIAAIEGI